MYTKFISHHILAGLKLLYAFSSVYHFSCKDKYFPPNFQIKLSKSCQRAPVVCFVFFLFHWPYHRFDELDFLVRQAVLLIEFFIRPRLAEVLEGDELETIFGNMNRG